MFWDFEEKVEQGRGVVFKNAFLCYLQDIAACVVKISRDGRMRSWRGNPNSGAAWCSGDTSLC